MKQTLSRPYRDVNKQEKITATITLTLQKDATSLVKEQRALQQDTDSPQFKIEDILELLPETKKIIEYAHQCLWAMHEDESIPKISQFFTQIVLENESILSNLILQEKAQILFSQYKKMLVHIFEASQNFITPLSQLQVRFPEEKTLPLSMRKIIEKEIDCLHSTVPRIAISTSLKGRIQDIHLQREASPAITEMLECLIISSKTQQLFQALLESRL